MPIAPPVPHTTIDTAAWGIPITNAVNAIYPGEYVHTTITAHATITATTAAAAQTFLNAGPITFDGSPIMVEFFTSNAQCPPNAQLIVNLWDTNADTGYLAQIINPGATVLGMPVLAKRRLVPAAGSHTYNLRGWITSGTSGQISAGAGTAPNQSFPAYLRIARCV